jgi:hypothetical protein
MPGVTAAPPATSTRTCATCDGPLHKRPDETTRRFAARRYCSTRCAHAAQRHYRPPPPPPPPPASTMVDVLDQLRALRRHLANARARGERFDQAWAGALHALGLDYRDDMPWDAQHLRTAVEATRASWRRAYLGRPPTCGDEAAGRLPYWGDE